MCRDTVSRCLETSLHFWGCPTSRVVMVARPRRCQGRGPAGGLRPALTPAAISSGSDGTVPPCRRSADGTAGSGAAGSRAVRAGLPARPALAVLGNAAANAALSRTAKHPAACDLVPMHLARVEAVEHGLTDVGNGG